MTEKQRRFCEEFIVSGNASQAALAAGYSHRNNCIQTLRRPEIQAYLANRMSQIALENSIKRVASPEEILGFLSAVMRGDVFDFAEKNKDGEVVNVQRQPTLKQRVAAAALLGKRYGLFAERVCLEEASRVVISEVDIPE